MGFWLEDTRCSVKARETEAFGREWRLFFKRASVLALLLVAFAAYGHRGRFEAFWLHSVLPIFIDPSLEAPPGQAALHANIPPELREILREAEVGIVGPAMKRALTEAEARGDLDRPVYGNKSLRDFLVEAQGLAEKARTLPRHVGLKPEDTRPEDFDPAVVIPLMVKALQDSEPTTRMNATMTLADNDFARHAEEAIPYLEPLLQDTDPDIRWFAELALKRIRYFATHQKIH